MTTKREKPNSQELGPTRKKGGGRESDVISSDEPGVRRNHETGAAANTAACPMCAAPNPGTETHFIDEHGMTIPEAYGLLALVGSR